MAETHHEVTRRETFDRRRRSQDQCQPRRSLLERHEGNLGLAKHDAVRTCRRDRQQPPTGQPVLSNTSLRAGLFSHSCAAYHHRFAGDTTARLGAFRLESRSHCPAFSRVAAHCPAARLSVSWLVFFSALPITAVCKRALSG